MIKLTLLNNRLMQVWIGQKMATNKNLLSSSLNIVSNQYDSCFNNDCLICMVDHKQTNNKQTNNAYSLEWQTQMDSILQGLFWSHLIFGTWRWKTRWKKICFFLRKPLMLWSKRYISMSRVFICFLVCSVAVVFLI